MRTLLRPAGLRPVDHDGGARGDPPLDVGKPQPLGYAVSPVSEISASVVLLVEPDLAAQLAGGEPLGVDLRIGLAAAEGLHDLRQCASGNALRRRIDDIVAARSSPSRCLSQDTVASRPVRRRDR